ncbi:MAG: deoxyribodipyrimidine photo-lyase [Gemmatimonadetes bacterium]|nr:deoxyribodipyrimidine photo-lyase [Gemmatimonadota bacterium]
MTLVDPSRLHVPPVAHPRPGGEFVLYWLQATFRAHDNFALNFAIEQADALSVPVLVYHGLRHDYPWASARLHTWILESVVDLRRDFAAKGIQYAFWLDRSRGAWTDWPAGRRGSDAAGQDAAADWSPLVHLADRAALVVTDYTPTFIHPRQLRGLRKRTATPVIAVDSATVVPMAAHAKEHSTARGFRTALLEPLAHHLWPVPNPLPRVRRPVDVGFEDDAPAVTPATIASLVAGCDVDQAVAASPMFRGGTAAGRARLHEFVARGLARYADDRNDPNNLEAVSRLSPWLHFGNVSIHEVLLTARAAGPAAAYAKFEDEAVTWRELAHNFCHWNPKHRTVAGIPAWAREQLASHEADPRPAHYTLAQLERGDGRPALERDAALLPAGRVDAQLRADAVGEGGPHVDAGRGRVPGIPGAPQQQVQPGRAGPEQLRRDHVDVREVRPAVLPAPHLRDGALPVAQGGGGQVRRAGVHPAVFLTLKRRWGRGPGRLAV